MGGGTTKKLTNGHCSLGKQQEIKKASVVVWEGELQMNWKAVRCLGGGGQHEMKYSRVAQGKRRRYMELVAYHMSH